MAARKYGVTAILMQQELARKQAAQDRAQAALQRQLAQAKRALDRAKVADEKERKRLYAAARQAEVDAVNESLESQISRLQNLVHETLSIDDHVTFESLKSYPEVTDLHRGALGVPGRAPSPQDFQVTPLTGPRRYLPGAKEKHAERQLRAQNLYQMAFKEHLERERQRLSKLARLEREHEEQCKSILQEAERHNQEIDRFKADFDAGDPDAIVSYFGMVLQRSSYPEDFPKQCRLAYIPESRQLVVEICFPSASIVPPVKASKYVKSRDEIVPIPRPVTQIKSVFASVAVGMTLRTLHELFEADRTGKVETVVLNGFVNTIDPATGKAIKPTIVTVRTTREAFQDIDLEQVEPLACLKHLGASVSKNPSELSPVRPVLEFDMVDHRFVQETNVIAGLDARPNLMELTPSEFESLITNLFARMGLETRLTQASRDGGVDCVAFDLRPIFGGKVVIQAKRYKGTVGVSAVRDLFGTVHNEGASKGILVTTSGYGSASMQFANGKPLELIDGAGLLYLLAEHAGIEARIEAPEDWSDPADAILA